MVSHKVNWLLCYRFFGLNQYSFAVGAASQWWSNERMMAYFKLMMVKCYSMMVKWVNDHTLNSPSLTIISPSLTSILPSLAWSKPIIRSFDHHWEAAPTGLVPFVSVPISYLRNHEPGLVLPVPVPVLVPHLGPGLHEGRRQRGSPWGLLKWMYEVYSK